MAKRHTPKVNKKVFKEMPVHKKANYGIKRFFIKIKQFIFGK